MNSEARTEATIHIDTSLIPDPVRDRLSVAAMEMVLGIIRKPGGRELLEKKKAEIAKRSRPCR
ncbi:hypothetical protein [Acutalibacter muris]|uniref:hypothetical protein n=1 Tax=Acutalibacter muris TaxID=1796620 RepID=UPI00272BE2BA|nr:hypothetical protein [Acutalibacter muris]